MARSPKSSLHAIDNNLSQEDSSAHKDSSSSEQEQYQEVFLQPSQAQTQVISNMFMPHIEVLRWIVLLMMVSTTDF